MCCIFLRLKSDPELYHGMELMRYTANHNENFKYPHTGFFAGWMQATMAMIIEALNQVWVLAAHGILVVFWRYLTVFLIMSFDDMIYQSLKDEPLKILIEEAPYKSLIKFEVKTKQKKAPVEHVSLPEADKSVVNDTSRAKKAMRVLTWGKRTLLSKVMYLIYRVYRILYISVWFYFLPYAVFMNSYLMPYYINKRLDAEAAAV